MINFTPKGLIYWINFTPKGLIYWIMDDRSLQFKLKIMVYILIVMILLTKKFIF
jgi:hypothetical protein